MKAKQLCTNRAERVCNEVNEKQVNVQFQVWWCIDKQEKGLFFELYYMGKGKGSAMRKWFPTYTCLSAFLEGVIVANNSCIFN